MRQQYEVDVEVKDSLDFWRRLPHARPDLHLIHLYSFHLAIIRQLSLLAEMQLSTTQSNDLKPSATAFVLDVAKNVLGWCMRSAAPRLWDWLRGNETHLEQDDHLLSQRYSVEHMQLLVDNLNDFKMQQRLMISVLEDLLEEVKRIPKEFRVSASDSQ